MKEPTNFLIYTACCCSASNLTFHASKRDRSSAYVENENGVLLRDVELIHERWVRWLHTILNAKSLRLDPSITEGLDQWPENMPLGVQPTMQEMTDAIRSLVNGKAVGPDGVFVELFQVTLNGDPALRRRLLDIVVCIWRGGDVPQQWKMPSSWYSTKRRIGQSAAITTGVSRW